MSVNVIIIQPHVDCLQGGMSEETRSKLSLLDLVDPPMKSYSVPWPKDGLIYDYRFIKVRASTF